MVWGLLPILMVAGIFVGMQAIIRRSDDRGDRAGRCDFCHDPLLWLRLRRDLTHQPHIEFSINEILSFMCVHCAKVNVPGVKLLERYGALEAEGSPTG